MPTDSVNAELTVLTIQTKGVVYSPFVALDLTLCDIIHKKHKGRERTIREIWREGKLSLPLHLFSGNNEFFWLEFESWIENSKYHPKGRRWKWKKEVTSYDVRHLVWNIGKRMGMDKGYNVIVCAAFTKMMFPDICENVKESTLSQTMKANPDKGHIKIDEPEPNCPFKFHTDTEQE